MTVRFLDVGEGDATLIESQGHFLLMDGGDRDRLNQPTRAAEKISQGLMGLLRPVIPANLRAIDARDVALSLIDAVRERQPGQQVLLSGALQRH